MTSENQFIIEDVDDHGKLKSIYLKQTMNSLPFSINVDISSFQVLLSGSQLEFYNREIYGSNVRYFSVNLDCPNLKASTNVYSYEDDANRLALLFQEMNENWRGWEGKKEWSSLGGGVLSGLYM